MSINPGETGKAEDFINVSERNADTSQDAGRVFKAEDDGFQSGETVKQVVSLPSFDTIDGTTTPKAVLLNGGSIALSDAGVVGKTQFYGFVRKTVTGLKAEFLNGANLGGSTTESFTANAGNARVLILQINYALVGGITTATSVTYDGNPMTELHAVGGSYSGMALFYIVLGDSASNETGDIVITGGSAIAGKAAVVWQGVNQSNPIQDSDLQAFTSGNSTSITVTKSEATQPVIQVYCARNGNTTTQESGFTKRYIDATARFWADDVDNTGAGSLELNTTHTGGSFNTTERGVAGGIVLANDLDSQESVEVWNSGIVPGFTGLVAGASYFVDDATPGAIAVDGGGAKVGIAISDTQILIQAPARRVANGVVSASNGDQTITCGFRPRIVRVYATTGGGSSRNAASSWGTFNEETGQSCAWEGTDTNLDDLSGVQGSLVWYLRWNDDVSQGIVDNITSTGFRLNETASISYGYNIHWEAEE